MPSTMGVSDRGYMKDGRGYYGHPPSCSCHKCGKARVASGETRQIYEPAGKPSVLPERRMLTKEELEELKRPRGILARIKKWWSG